MVISGRLEMVIIILRDGTFKTRQDAQVVLEALESVNRLNNKYKIEEVEHDEGEC